MDGRAHGRARRLWFGLSLCRERQARGRRRRDSVARSVDLDGLRGGGDEMHQARHGHPDPAAAQSRGRRQAGGDPRPYVGRTHPLGDRGRLAEGGVRGARRAVRGARAAHGRVHQGDARAVERRQADVQRPVRAVQGRLLPAAAGQEACADHRRRAFGGGGEAGRNIGNRRWPRATTIVSTKPPAPRWAWPNSEV